MFYKKLGISLTNCTITMGLSLMFFFFLIVFIVLDLQHIISSLTILVIMINTYLKYLLIFQVRVVSLHILMYIIILYIIIALSSDEELHKLLAPLTAVR